MTWQCFISFGYIVIYPLMMKTVYYMASTLMYSYHTLFISRWLVFIDVSFSFLASCLYESSMMVFHIVFFPPLFTYERSFALFYTLYRLPSRRHAYFLTASLLPFIYLFFLPLLYSLIYIETWPRWNAAPFAYQPSEFSPWCLEAIWDIGCLGSGTFGWHT